MAFRRELLGAVLAAALLLTGLAAPAGAAPRFVAANTLDGAGGTPDVTADAGGNSAAVWNRSGHIEVAERPFGGPWGSPTDLQPDGAADAQDPKIVALPDGELVATWVVGTVVQAADRPAGGSWTRPVGISSHCCPLLRDLVTGADGTALAFWSADGSQTAVKPPGATTWDPAQAVPDGQDAHVAVAPDGSAEIAYETRSCAVADCVSAAHRPPGGAWGGGELAGSTSSQITGLALAARPDSSFTVVWGQDTQVARAQGPPGAVLSADRSAGSRGSWGSPQTVAALPSSAPGCPSSTVGCFDLASRGDTLAAVWQQGNNGASGEIAASLRTASGAWGARERVGAADFGDALPQAAITTGGIPVAAWGGTSGSEAARGAHRSADATWSDGPLGNAAEGIATVGGVVADGQGDAIAGWHDPADGARAAGFDGVGPRFTAFSAPATGSVGRTLGFSAAAQDNWSAVAGIGWLFGDGGSASGGDVSHAYGAPGTSTATATATDAVGNASQRSAGVNVAATPTPTPEPCGSTDRDGDGILDGCDTNDGSQAPKPFKTVNATVVSGDVFLKLPAGGAAARAAAGAKAPKGFVRLQGAETIPVGSTLDTAKGKVLLRSAKDTRRHTQVGEFNAGRFVIRQLRKPRTKSGRRSTGLITELRLTGSSFRRACATAKKASISRRRSRKRVRRLFGDGKGSFRTRGRNAAATVRGTRWGVQDRCDGTLVTVRRGVVSVRDLVRHRTVRVKAGHTYLARLRG